MQRTLSSTLTNILVPTGLYIFILLFLEKPTISDELTNLVFKALMCQRGRKVKKKVLFSCTSLFLRATGNLNTENKQNIPNFNLSIFSWATLKLFF
jgi:hypothetical protein